MFWIASIFATTVASAQVPPPPGGGGLGTPPTDTNPYNIHNWKRDLPVEGSHTHDGYGWYRDENGVIKQNPCNFTIIPAPSSPELVSLTANTSLAPRSAKSHSIANVKIRWQWIGVGIAPQKVWVRKKATAYASVAPNGTMTVSNGLGSPVKTEVESPHLTKYCTGTKLEEVTLSGNFLEVPFSLEATAESTNSTPTYGNQCHTSLSYGISLKGFWLGGTMASYREVGGLAVINTALDKRIDVVAPYVNTNLHTGNGVFGANVTRSLVGPWRDPFHFWFFSFGSGTDWRADDAFNEYSEVYATKSLSASEMRALVMSNGSKAFAKLRLKDTHPAEDPTEQTDVIEIFGHSERERPWRGATSEDIGYQHKHIFASIAFPQPVGFGHGSVQTQPTVTAFCDFFGYAANTLGGVPHPLAAAIGAALDVWERTQPAPTQVSINFTSEAFNHPNSVFSPNIPAPIDHWLMSGGTIYVRRSHTVIHSYKFGQGGYEGIDTDDLQENLSGSSTAGTFIQGVLGN